MTARRPTSDPDGFFTTDALQPDPVFLGLRAIVSTGPIGRLRLHFDAWREEREERRYAAERAVDVASSIVRQSHIPSTTAARDQINHDLAA